MQATLVTWALVGFGVVTLIPLFVAQVSMLTRPDSKETRNLLIGKGEDWRNKTHFRMSLGAAWADWLFLAPLFVAGSVGVLLGQSWGGILAMEYALKYQDQLKGLIHRRPGLVQAANQHGQMRIGVERFRILAAFGYQLLHCGERGLLGEHHLLARHASGAVDDQHAVGTVVGQRPGARWVGAQESWRSDERPGDNHQQHVRPRQCTRSRGQSRQGAAGGRRSQK